MILIIDNYDSFAYNLVQFLDRLGAETVVRRNDAISVQDIARLCPEALVLSPGPCGPAEAGVCVPAIRALAGTLPILGVCLGHQAIGHAFGATVRRAARPVHGKTSLIRHDGKGCFAGLPSPLEACRYHSLAVDAASLPDCLEPAAFAPDGELMALRHRFWPIEGLQFHPESIFTPDGLRVLDNFLRIAERWRQARERGGREVIVP